MPSNTEKKPKVIKQAELDIVCGVTSRLPDTGMPEVAFAGKSNVGKSSLDQRAYEPQIPGADQRPAGQDPDDKFLQGQQGNVSGGSSGIWIRQSFPVRKEKWGKMIERYLHTSRNLKAVFLLIDIRHAPSANDCQMYEWILHNGFRPIIIATKLDKLKRSQVQRI